jgi:hypothetical protein
VQEGEECCCHFSWELELIEIGCWGAMLQVSKLIVYIGGGGWRLKVVAIFDNIPMT